jgi:multiple sugar transport system permease protein
MKKQSRTLLFLAALLGLALPSLAPAKVILHIPDYPVATDTRSEADAAREGILLFEEKNPDIQIDRAQTIGRIGNLFEAPELMAIAGGTAPDVMSLWVHKVQNYIEQGFCQPIEDKIATWPDKDKMPEAYWPVLTSGKHVYGVVYFYYTLQLMYRKDMFQEAGLDPEKPPKTWDELYDYAQKLTNQDKIIKDMATNKKGQYGLQLNAGSWHFPMFVWQAGGEVVEPYLVDSKGDFKEEITADELYRRRDSIDATSVKWKATYDEKPGVQALEFWKKLKWGKWSRDGKDYEGVCTVQGWDFDEFALGKVAMKIFVPDWNGTFFTNYGLSPSQVGLAPLPAGPGGSANYAAGDVYVINSSVKDPAVRDAAWKYIAFKISDDYRRIVVKHQIQSNNYITMRPDELERFGYGSYLDRIPQNWKDSYKQTMQNLHVEPYAPNYQVVQTNELDVPIGKVMDDKDTDPYTVLHASAQRVNEVIFGVRTPTQMAHLRRYAKIGFGLFLVLMAGIFYWQLGGSGAKLPAGVNPSAVSAAGIWTKRGFDTQLKVWGMLSAAVLSILVWNYLPLIQGAWMAFYDYKLVLPSRFVGLDNFIEICTQPLFRQVIFNTLYYVILSMSLGFAAPIALAILLAEVPKGKITFRVIYYLPAVMAPLVVALMWTVLFDQTSDGALNQVIGAFGIGAQKWLQDSKLAMLCVVATGVWTGAGAACLIYLAALKTIPDDIYDAADLDGCSTWHKVRYITLPYLLPLLLINFLGAMIGSFHASGNILVMTQGGPANATRVIGLDIYLNAFMFLKYGLAISQAWILGSTLIGFTLYQLKIFKRSEFRTADAS